MLPKSLILSSQSEYINSLARMGSPRMSERLEDWIALANDQTTDRLIRCSVLAQGVFRHYQKVAAREIFRELRACRNLFSISKIGCIFGPIPLTLCDLSYSAYQLEMYTSGYRGMLYFSTKEDDIESILGLQVKGDWHLADVAIGEVFKEDITYEWKRKSFHPYDEMGKPIKTGTIWERIRNKIYTVS